jgi:hypothetical protein
MIFRQFLSLKGTRSYQAHTRVVMYSEGICILDCFQREKKIDDFRPCSLYDERRSLRSWLVQRILPVTEFRKMDTVLWEGWKIRFSEETKRSSKTHSVQNLYSFEQAFRISDYFFTIMNESNKKTKNSIYYRMSLFFAVLLRTALYLKQEVFTKEIRFFLFLDD